MNFRKLVSWILLLLSGYVVIADAGRDRPVILMQTESLQGKTTQAEFIRAEELKAKLARNEMLTIIDVRDTRSYVDSNNKIKGALYVKLRRLNYRLSFVPLRDVPRDS